jgi:hypothetical protein
MRRACCFCAICLTSSFTFASKPVETVKPKGFPSAERNNLNVSEERRKRPEQVENAPASLPAVNEWS